MSDLDENVVSDIKPHWLKIKIRCGEQFASTARLVEMHSLNTICSSGMCPNKTECWSRRTATFMILGQVCTRGCRFCATSTGNPSLPECSEPSRVARSISLMELRHAVITSVTRDDLPDQGAGHWADTVVEVRSQNPQATIELLIPDMSGQKELVDIIAATRPDIIGHNIETVERLTPQIRSRADYRTSLRTIEHIASSGTVPKSGIMVGLGETDEELLATLRDLRNAGCRIVTIGQYLRPSLKHWPVSRYVTPARFEEYKESALSMGFDFVASGPLVRSSYLADEAIDFIRKGKI